MPIVTSFKYGVTEDRALDHPILGPKFGPVHDAKKYGFFSNSRQKISNLTKKKQHFFLHLYFI